MWQQFGRLNEHGKYTSDIPDEECEAPAREIKEYENAFLTQQISFLDNIHEFFNAHKLRHDQKMYDYQKKRFSDGEPVNVMVYHAGEWEEHRVIKRSENTEFSRWGTGIKQVL